MKLPNFLAGFSKYHPCHKGITIDYTLSFRDFGIPFRDFLGTDFSRYQIFHARNGKNINLSVVPSAANFGLLCFLAKQNIFHAVFTRKSKNPIVFNKVLLSILLTIKREQTTCISFRRLPVSYRRFCGTQSEKISQRLYAVT